MASPSRNDQLLKMLRESSSRERTDMGVPGSVRAPEVSNRAEESAEWRIIDEVSSEPGSAERAHYRELEEQLRALQLKLEELEETKEESRLGTPIKSGATPGTHLFKPRDVKTLELEQLQKIDASARLQIFFSSVERCAESSQDRLYIASTKVDNQLAVMLSNAQRKGQVNSWEDWKGLLIKEFSRNANFNETWQQVVGVRYDWHRDPHEFAQKFKCSYSAIESSFPNTPLPDRDTQIKNLLVNGFPTGRSREYLRTFCHESVTLEHFLTQCLYEKAVMERGTPVGAKVLSMNPREGGGEVATGNTGTPPGPSRGEGSRRLGPTGTPREGTGAVAPYSSPQRGANSRWCSYCRTDTHMWRECVYRPGRGECWDCGRTGCRRGKPGCPGKKKSASGEQNWRQPNAPRKESSPLTPTRREVNIPKVRNMEAQDTVEEHLDGQTEEQ